jgi:hypothetical protein
MTLSVEQEQRRASRESERTRLVPFVVIGGDASPRDQRDLMERPFFSLSKSPRIKPILYRAHDIEVQVFGTPEHGMATIWDADVLIWAASQIVRAENLGLATSRFFRFTPYQLLRGVGRPTGNQQYLLLKARWPGCNRRSSPPPSATASIGGAANSPGLTNGRRCRRGPAASRAWNSCCPNGSTAASSTARWC